jgi:hypothetical protein
VTKVTIKNKIACGAASAAPFQNKPFSAASEAAVFQNELFFRSK